MDAAPDPDIYTYINIYKYIVVDCIDLVRYFLIYFVSVFSEIGLLKKVFILSTLRTGVLDFQSGPGEGPGAE